MKPFALLLLLVLAGVPARGAQPAEALRRFEEGNRRYESGDYRGALAAYREVIRAGTVSGALFYNMGNAYFRMGALGEAILHYERARRLIPASTAVRRNLDVALTHTADRFPARPRPFWSVWWDRLALGLGPRVLFLAGLGAYLACLALVGVRIWTGRPSAWRRRALLLLAPLALLVLAASFVASEGRPGAAGVVLAPAAPLREEAAGAPGSIVVHEGLVVEILRNREGWMEVRLPDGTRGWLEAGAIGVV